jgi:hypothetical protein
LKTASEREREREIAAAYLAEAIVTTVTESV